MIEKISQKLDGWEKVFLSLGGRITLMILSNHVCLISLTYFLSLLKIPSSVVLKIKKMQRDFFSQGLDDAIPHTVPKASVNGG